MDESPEVEGGRDDEIRLVEKQIELEKAKKATLDAVHRNVDQAERGGRRDEGKARRKAIASMSTTGKLIALAAVIAGVVLVAGFVLPSIMPKHENRYYTDSDLEKVVDIEELSTVEYVYGGIAEKLGLLGMVDYRVRYEAHVSVAFNMSEIKIHADNDAKTIEVMLPEPQIKEPVININNCGYLPERAQGELSDVYGICQEDAAKEIEGNNEIRTRAYESLESTVKALTEPLLTGDYTFSWKDASGNALEGVDDAA